MHRLDRLAKPVVWTRVAVALGLGLRLWYYLRDLPVWHDEAALVNNVLAKGFIELLGPLLFHEAAPPGFLWLEHAVYRLLGDNPWALRLPAFLASCAALLLFARLARHWLPETAVPWAVLLLAVSDRLLWHSCEAKPYAVDVLLATLVLTLFDASRSWQLSRQLMLFAALSPVLLFVSFPGCFLCGALLVALLPAVWRERCWWTWLGYIAWAGIVGGTFLLLLIGPIRAQRCPEMDGCWTSLFPDLSRPGSVPLWVLQSTLDVAHYACNPNGGLLGLLFGFLGIAVLWRQGYRSRVVLLTLPAGLAMVAAFLHAYPYGGARVLAYAAPGAILLIAAGFHAVAVKLHAWHPALPALPAILLLLPAANTAHRLVVPWARADCAGATAYVLRQHQAGEQVVVNSWEGLYYFRCPPSTCDFRGDGATDPDRPLWLVLTNFNAAERQDLAQHLAGSRAVLDRREFAQTTVLYLSARN